MDMIKVLKEKVNKSIKINNENTNSKMKKNRLRFASGNGINKETPNLRKQCGN